MFAKEGEHLAPAIHCLLRPVEWPVPIEDAVASTIVAVELMHLALLLKLGLVLVHLLGARRAVVVAEYAEQRAADVLRLAGIDECVPTTRTGAENADLAIVIGLRAYPLHCGLGIADHLGVGNAAVSAHFGGDVVWVALARTLIEVSADREIAVMREPTRRLNVELAPAREMVDKHNARKGAWTRRLGHISGNRGSLVAFEGHVLASHASVE